MRYKLLGPSGLRVSEICLGTMSFGDAWGFGADEKESHRILDAYAEAGGNFIDTANKYHEGQSEEIVGGFIGRRPRPLGGGDQVHARHAPATPTPPATRARTCASRWRRSLRRLRTDYIDLLWVHAWDYRRRSRRSCAASTISCAPARSTTSASPTRRPGSSAQANTLAALRGWSPFVALQLEYSLIERTAERELLPMADAFGLAVTAWAPLGGGVLTGKYTRGSTAIPGGLASGRATTSHG